MKVDGRCFVAAKKPATSTTSAASLDTAPEDQQPPEQQQLAVNEQFNMQQPSADSTDDLSELDFTDLLEEDEGSTDHLSEHGIDLGEALHGLTRILRKQHQQMDEHDQRIEGLRQLLSELVAR